MTRKNLLEIEGKSRDFSRLLFSLGEGRMLVRRACVEELTCCLRIRPRYGRAFNEEWSILLTV